MTVKHELVGLLLQALFQLDLRLARELLPQWRLLRLLRLDWLTTEHGLHQLVVPLAQGVDQL